MSSPRFDRALSREKMISCLRIRPRPSIPIDWLRESSAGRGFFFSSVRFICPIRLVGESGGPERRERLLHVPAPPAARGRSGVPKAEPASRARPEQVPVNRREEPAPSCPVRSGIASAPPASQAGRPTARSAWPEKTLARPGNRVQHQHRPTPRELERLGWVQRRVSTARRSLRPAGWTPGRRPVTWERPGEGSLPRPAAAHSLHVLISIRWILRRRGAAGAGRSYRSANRRRRRRIPASQRS